MDGEVLTRIGGALLVPPALYWLFVSVPVGLEGSIPLESWLLLLPTVLIGLALCASAVADVLGRVIAAVPGATLGLASGAWCVARLCLTTERGRQVVDGRFAGVASTWWLVAVVVCGTLAAIALLDAPGLREDSGPSGGQIARDSWRWAAITVAVIELSFVVAQLNLMWTAPVPLSGPSTGSELVLGLLWLCCGAVAAAGRGTVAMGLAAAFALAAISMLVARDVGHGFGVVLAVGDQRVWLGAVLLVNAGVVIWLLPLLTGWTPAVRRQLAARPKGLFD